MLRVPLAIIFRHLTARGLSEEQILRLVHVEDESDDQEEEEKEQEEEKKDEEEMRGETEEEN